MTTEPSVIRLHTAAAPGWISPVPIASVQGALALDLTPREDPPAAPMRAVRFDEVEPDPMTREQVDAFVRRFLQAASEIAIGDRPVRQLLRHCVPTVYDDLVARATRTSRAAGTSPARGRGRGTVRPVTVSVRTSLVRADALEACAHVRFGRRSRAIAARFEEMQGRWQCVSMEWG